MTTYLKFADQTACIEAFAARLVTDPHGDSHMPAYIATPAGPSAVDVVGTIHKPTGRYTQGELGPMPVFAALDGWHVNLSCAPGDCPADLQPFVIDAPATPSRVFA